MKHILLILLLCFLFGGCTEVRECIRCQKGNGDKIHQCEEDVLGWNAESLTDYYESHGYVCKTTIEDRVTWEISP